MTSEKTKKPLDLVSGIIDEAEGQAEKIVREARVSADRRTESAEKQAAELLERKKKEAQERRAAIIRDAERRASLELHRMALKEQEHLLEKVSAEARRRMETLTGEPAYRGILKGWIVEAAVGLGSTAAVVTTSSREAGQIDGSLLREAEKEVRRLTGRTVTITFDPAKPLAGQGIVLSDEGGTRAFNNQVSTRLVRYTSALRGAIYKELFTES